MNFNALAAKLESNGLHSNSGSKNQKYGRIFVSAALSGSITRNLKIRIEGKENLVNDVYVYCDKKYLNEVFEQFCKIKIKNMVLDPKGSGNKYNLQIVKYLSHRQLLVMLELRYDKDKSFVHAARVFEFLIFLKTMVLDIQKAEHILCLKDKQLKFQMSLNYTELSRGPFGSDELLSKLCLMNDAVLSKFRTIYCSLKYTGNPHHKHSTKLSFRAEDVRRAVAKFSRIQMGQKNILYPLDADSERLLEKVPRFLRNNKY